MAKARKNLYVLYTEDDWGLETPLPDSPETRKSFEEFYLWAKEHGVTVYRANIDWYDEQSGIFLKAWTFDGQWQKVLDPPEADAYFDKIAGKYNYALWETKLKIAGTKPLVNSPFFRLQFDSKLSQYLAFERFMPVSHLAENPRDLAKALKKIKSPKVVAKELFGSGGKEVVIGEKENFSPGELSFPLLVQEFVATAGVPGFSQESEIADLRMIFVGHQFIYALSRKAKGDSLFTNFHQGAAARLVPEESIPAPALKIAKKIIRKLKVFPRTHYSLDFMFTTDGEPIFIEMNTTPGFDLLLLVAPPELRQEHARRLIKMIFSK